MQSIMIDLSRFVPLLAKEVEDLAQDVELQREQALCNSAYVNVFAEFIALIDRARDRPPLGLLLYDGRACCSGLARERT